MAELPKVSTSSDIAISDPEGNDLQGQSPAVLSRKELASLKAELTRLIDMNGHLDDETVISITQKAKKTNSASDTDKAGLSNDQVKRLKQFSESNFRALGNIVASYNEQIKDGSFPLTFDAGGGVFKTDLDQLKKLTALVQDSIDAKNGYFRARNAFLDTYGVMHKVKVDEKNSQLSKLKGQISSSRLEIAAANRELKRVETALSLYPSNKNKLDSRDKENIRNLEDEKVKLEQKRDALQLSMAAAVAQSAKYTSKPQRKIFDQYKVPEDSPLREVLLTGFNSEQSAIKAIQSIEGLDPDHKEGAVNTIKNLRGTLLTAKNVLAAVYPTLDSERQKLAKLKADVLSKEAALASDNQVVAEIQDIANAFNALNPTEKNEAQRYIANPQSLEGSFLNKANFTRLMNEAKITSTQQSKLRELLEKRKSEAEVTVLKQEFDQVKIEKDTLEKDIKAKEQAVNAQAKGVILDSRQYLSTRNSLRREIKAEKEKGDQADRQLIASKAAELKALRAIGPRVETIDERKENRRESSIISKASLGRLKVEINKAESRVQDIIPTLDTDFRKKSFVSLAAQQALQSRGIKQPTAKQMANEVKVISTMLSASSGTSFKSTLSPVRSAKKFIRQAEILKITPESLRAHVVQTAKRKYQEDDTKKGWKIFRFFQQRAFVQRELKKLSEKPPVIATP